LILKKKKKKKKKKIKFVRWDRYKCLELKKEIFDHNKFEIQSKEFRKCRNFQLIVKLKKFINSTNSIAKDLSIISSTETRKAMFRMSHKIYCLQKVKHININKLSVINLQVIPMNLQKLLTRIIDYCESIN